MSGISRLLLDLVGKLEVVLRFDSLIDIEDSGAVGCKEDLFAVRAPGRIPVVVVVIGDRADVGAGLPLPSSDLA